MFYTARITEVEGEPVQRITVQVDPAYAFSAGQYLLVDGGNDVLIPMSIASAPARLPQLCLHYRSTPGLPEAAAMDAALLGDTLRVSPAEGTVDSGSPDIAQLMVVGGSGAAQAFSCAEHRALQGDCASTTIVWCADHAEQLYELQFLRDLPRTALHTIIDDRRTAQNEGMQWLRDHAHTYAEHEILICGSPGFVYAVTDVLQDAGISAAQMRADAYAYAPRT